MANSERPTDDSIVTRNPIVKKTFRWSVENVSHVVEVKIPELLLLPGLVFSMKLWSATEGDDKYAKLELAKVRGDSPLSVELSLSFVNSEDREFEGVTLNRIFRRDEDTCSGYLEYYDDYDYKDYLDYDDDNDGRKRINLNCIQRDLLSSDDNLIILCGFRVSGHGVRSVVSYSPPVCNGSESLVNDFAKMLTDSKFADVTFVVEEKCVPSHKVVLCARSPVFARMFENDMKESREDRVVITDIEYPVFESFLRYVYTGDVKGLTFDKAEALYYPADKYAVDGLKKLCASVVCSKATADKVVRVLKLASTFNDVSLKKFGQRFCSDFWPSIRKTDEWEALKKENPGLALEITNDMLPI